MTVPDWLHGTTTVEVKVMVVTGPDGVVVAPGTLEAQLRIAGLVPIWFTQIPWK